MDPPESKLLAHPRERRYSLLVIFYGVMFSILLFFLSLVRPALTDFLDNKVYDMLLTAGSDGSSSIPVIVDIDEKSLRQYGQWPWPRYRIATLLNKLRAWGALSIGLDMLFAEEDRTSITAVRKDLLHDFGINLKFREVPRDLRDNDERLAEALSGGSVVLGYQFLFEEDSASDNCLLHPVRVNRLGTGNGEAGSPLFIRARRASGNLNMLSQAAEASGFFNVSPDPDGILRRVPLIIEHKGKFYPSLALATWMRSLGTHDVLLRTNGKGPESLTVDRTTIPLSSEGTMLIRFRGKGKSFHYVSASDVLSGRCPKAQIRGKVVFVGTSASGMKELKPTPFDPVFPGVEVHATVVDNLLRKDFLSRPPWVPGVESLGALVFGLLSTLILAWTGAGWSPLLLGGTGLGLWQASVWTFRNEGIFVSPVLPLLILVCNFSLITLIKFWREEQRTRERTRELAMVQEATIESMSSLTETRDPDTGGHIKRTQNYLRLLADNLKHQHTFRSFLNGETIDLLWKSAPLHDIGKVGVSDKILLKPGRLTDQEFEEMKLHTVYGRDAIMAAERKLGKASFLRFAREIAYTHHERWDGSGYPEGLKGDQIPLAGRLMALVDTYDALTSKRVYKSEMPHEDAVEIILGEKGSHFDPVVVDAFLEVGEDFRRVALRYADP
jgi:CHASE2 domain-containing sensor protein